MTEQLALDFSADRLNCEERAVYSRLREGRRNAVTAAFLSAETGIQEVRVRAIIRDIIMDHGLLVASVTSQPAGFFVPVTEEEIDHATSSLRSRWLAILQREARLRKSSVEIVLHLARLEMRETGT